MDPHRQISCLAKSVLAPSGSLAPHHSPSLVSVKSALPYQTNPALATVSPCLIRLVQLVSKSASPSGKPCTLLQSLLPHQADAALIQTGHIFECHAGPQHAQHELTDGRFGAMQFHVQPAVGVLEAGSETDMTISFAPDFQHRCGHMGVVSSLPLLQMALAKQENASAALQSFTPQTSL